MNFITSTRSLLMACALSSAFLALTPSTALAETPSQHRLIQHNANRVTAIASRLTPLVDRLQDVVPPIFGRSKLRKLQSGLEEIENHLETIAAMAKSSGEVGLIEEAAKLQQILEAAPNRKEISKVVLRRMPADGLIVELAEALDALRNAAPCIRREIQELDE